MNASPLTITGPADLVEAVPYLLGFTPADSLVIVGLAAKTVTVTVRADLAGLTPDQITELAETLRDKADATAMIALTYGSIADPEPVADAARAAGLQLAEHLRVDQGRYWSLTCPIEGCCPSEGRPIPPPGAVAAEFVLNGHAPMASRDDLAAVLQPDADQGRRLTAELERARGELADELAGAAETVLGADHCPDRCWTDEETVRLGVALSGYPVRDAAWMAIEDGSLDGRDLFAHLARTLPAGHRAPALFLFAWKTWRLGHGTFGLRRRRPGPGRRPRLQRGTPARDSTRRGDRPATDAAAGAARLSRAARHVSRRAGRPVTRPSRSAASTGLMAAPSPLDATAARSICSTAVPTPHGSQQIRSGRLASVGAGPLSSAGPRQFGHAVLL